MKRVILAKIAGLFLLGVLCFSCSSEEAIAGAETSAKTESVATFKKALNEYGRTRIGEYVSKGSPEANSVMAKASSEFLQSVGISKKAISAKSKLGDEAVISMAVLEYTKLKNNNPKS